MTEHFIINLSVLNRVYPLKIRREDEEIYRNAAKDIERKTTQYRNYFRGDDSNNLLEQDFLAMASIQALSETVELEARNELFENAIEALISELDEYLKKSE